jgi:hypothetical protein
MAYALRGKTADAAAEVAGMAAGKALDFIAGDEVLGGVLVGLNAR